MTEDDRTDEPLIELDEDTDIDEAEDDMEAGLAWGEKVRKRMQRILLEKVDLPLSQLVEMIDSKQIDLRPDFQRRDRWDGKRRSRLIESILMNVPIPPVFLGEEEFGNYVVLDGRQRLTALYDYLTNDFSLSGLVVWSELNGKRYKGLARLGDESKGDPRLDKAITRRFITAVVVRQESVAAVKYEVFDRLNTGGVIAEPMEIRNAVFRGQFNDLLHELSDEESFRTLWGIPTENQPRLKNAAYKKMTDLEMVLRFFAMQRVEDFKGRLKTFLNVIMEDRNKAYQSEPDLATTDAALFRKTMETTLAGLGSNALHRRLSDGARSPVPSAPLADAVLYAMSKFDGDVNDKAQRKALRKALDDLMKHDDMFAKAISAGTNDKRGTRYRMRAAHLAINQDVQTWDMPDDKREELMD